MHLWRMTRFLWIVPLSYFSQILLPAIFVCIAMAVAKIRPSYEMPPLELTTDMFLNAEPHVHYLPFAMDSQRGNSTDDLTDMVVKFPGVGKIRGGLFLL